MKKVIKLTEADILKMVKKVIAENNLNEVAEEPVFDDDGTGVALAFAEGQVNLTPKSRADVLVFLETFLKSHPDTIKTLERFYKSGNIPKFMTINVGTSHTGSPSANDRVAQGRLKTMESLIVSIFSRYGISAEVIRQFITNNTEKTYAPSSLDKNFYDPKKVKPDSVERIGSLTIHYLTTKGLKTAGIQDVQGKLNDASGYVYTDETSVVEAINKLETYSDIVDLDAALKAQRKWNGLEAFINNQMNDWGGEDDNEMMSIAQHLNDCAKASGKQKAVRLFRTGDGYKMTIDLTL